MAFPGEDVAAFVERFVSAASPSNGRVVDPADSR